MSNPSQSIEYKRVDDLRFDPENPRFPSSVDKHNEQDIIRFMLEDADIVSLMLSIGERGYFPGEALLAVPESLNSTSLMIIEGNRRLTAAKLLLNPDLAPIRKSSVRQASDEAKFKPTELPTIVFKQRSDILSYLGYRHITGVKTWGALAKAKYLKQLLQTFEQESSKEQYKALAKTIGSRSDYVARTLAGLAVYEKIVAEDFFDIKNLTEDSIEFAVLTTALGYQNISQFVGMESSQDTKLESLNRQNLQDLTEWVFKKNSEEKTRIGESRNLGDLNSVVGNTKALEAFRKGMPLSVAVQFTEKPGVMFRTATNSSYEQLEIARTNMHLVEDLSDADADALTNIYKLARSLRSVVEDSLLEQETRNRPK